MASGFAKDGAVEEQIEHTILDAINMVRSRMIPTNTTEYCLECDEVIPLNRRVAIPGVEHCIQCQQELETTDKSMNLFNRRGSKDSQLR